MPFPIANISQGAPANGPTERAVDAKSRTSMDKDAFLKLLIAQISNQDPMQPMQGTEYMQQLTQFAMVEQAQTQSAKLETISAQLTGLSSNEAASLIGKTVSIKGRGIAYDGLLATGGGVTLADKSAKVTVQILNPQGKPVRTMEMGAR
jgi:flagellar basal-body rod modification protein FlgD